MATIPPTTTSVLSVNAQASVPPVLRLSRIFTSNPSPWLPAVRLTVVDRLFNYAPESSDGYPPDE